VLSLAHCRELGFRKLKPVGWAVKTRELVAEHAVFGNRVAIACPMTNESYFRKKTVYWDAEEWDLRGISGWEFRETGLADARALVRTYLAGPLRLQVANVLRLT
jgi:hypothetical protein